MQAKQHQQGLPKGLWPWTMPRWGKAEVKYIQNYHTNMTTYIYTNMITNIKTNVIISDLELCLVEERQRWNHKNIHKYLEHKYNYKYHRKSNHIYHHKYIKIYHLKYNNKYLQHKYDHIAIWILCNQRKSKLKTFGMQTMFDKGRVCQNFLNPWQSGAKSFHKYDKIQPQISTRLYH